MAGPQLIWKVYAGVLGAATTMIAQKALSKGWKVVTGDDPPEVTDPDTPLGAAIAWAAATALGMGVSQLLMARFTASRWRRAYSETAVKGGRIKWRL